MASGRRAEDCPPYLSSPPSLTHYVLPLKRAGPGTKCNAGVIAGGFGGRPPARSRSITGGHGGLFEQLLGDLHGVQGGAFEELIARHPKAKSVVQRAIQPQPANLAIIFFRRRTAAADIRCLAGSSTTSRPGAFSSAARAAATVTGLSNSALTAMEWAR